MSAKKYIRRNIYRWHRVTSLLIAVPVLLWAVSGFLHPVMGSFKPDVKNSLLQAAEVDTSRISISLRAALQQNSIDSFQNFRVVKLYRGYYYQVWQKGFDSLTYLNCESGNVLLNGDKHYAAYLAQRFLWEDSGQQSSDEHEHGKFTASLSGGTPVPANGSLSLKPSSKITSTTLLMSFSKAYKPGNKILPVYEVAFQREDGIQLYIDTKTDRLVIASDVKKRWFTSFFAVTHTWSVLNGLGKTKSVLLGTFSALCFLSSIFGFAVYNVMKGKKKSTAGGKRWHQVLGNIFLLTTLLYSFSGAWHAFAKVPAKPNLQAVEKFNTSSNETYLNFKMLFSHLAPKEKLLNISIVKMNGETYWQLLIEKEKAVSKKYIHTKTNTILTHGDAKYAAALASRIKGGQIVATKPVTAFNHRYSMMNKRLPVMETRFANDESVFVETATGEIAAIIKPSDEAERFSFSNLHMHHYWEMWMGKEFGKTFKNAILIFSTLGLLLLALTGTVMCYRKQRKSSRKPNRIS